MKKTISGDVCKCLIKFMILMILFSNEFVCFAEDTPSPALQTLKLSKVFDCNGTWYGEIKEGAMGEGTPALSTKGTVSGKLTSGGFWYEYNMVVIAGSEKNMFTWKGHLVVGWDVVSKSYKAVLVDNLGIYLTMTGELTNSKFILTSNREGVKNGPTINARFTWDFSNPKVILFLNEHQVNNGPWRVFEVETIKPSKES